MGDEKRAQETWVQVRDGSIWASVELPPGTETRGVVVLAPPLALESVVTWRALRYLSRELAARGFTVIRFTWSGDGDSRSLELAEDAVEAWHDDLRAVATLARSLLDDGGPVMVVAVRVAASLVSGVAHLFDEVALWEPIGGRDFLRTSTALRRLHVSVPPISKDIVEFCGASFGREQIKRLRTVEAPPGRPVIWVDQEAAPAFYGISPQNAVVPVKSVADVVEVVSVLAPDRTWPRHAFEPVRETMMRTPSGRLVRERLEMIGPHRLPAVVTEPLDCAGPHRVFVFTSAGAEPRFAPSRVWVEGAREVASLGCVGVRADRRGLGEAWEPTSDRAPRVYSERGVADVTETTTWAARRWGAPIVGAGSCVGAWAHLLVSPKVAPAQLLLFEAQAWSDDPSLYVQQENGDTFFRRPPVASGLRADTFGETRRHRIVVKQFLTRLRPFVVSVQKRVTSSIPEFIWEWLARRSIVEYPYLPLSKADRTTVVDLQFDHRDWDRFARARGPQSIARLRSDGHLVRASVSSTLDHSLYSLAARYHVIDVLKRTASEAACADKVDTRGEG